MYAGKYNQFSKSTNSNFGLILDKIIDYYYMEWLFESKLVKNVTFYSLLDLMSYSKLQKLPKTKCKV